MNVTRGPAAGLATEFFDAETLALLDAIEVDLLEFSDVDLDVAFGTPLEMYEPWATPREATRLQEQEAQLGRARAEREFMAEFFARRHAAVDILAEDPTITARIRERLVDVLLPYAPQLAVTGRGVSASPARVRLAA